MSGDDLAAAAPDNADEEVQALMAKLSDLQTWCVLMACRQMPKAREAMDLVQETRAFIVSRHYPRARQGAPNRIVSIGDSNQPAPFGDER